ncbi:MAG: patatin-like phospholipase family protein [Bryobacteraceae bacterium]
MFTFLGRDELVQLQNLFVESTHPKDAVLFRSGDEGDTFSIVLRGELEVWAGEGQQRMTGTLKRGDFFGEMALLQGGRRTATIIVRRPAHLLTLSKAAFDTFFRKDPRMLDYFTQVLCQRLASVSKGAPVLGTSSTISVTGRPGLKGKTLVSSSLAGILHDLTDTDVLLIRVSPGEQGPEGAVAQLMSNELDTALEVVNQAIKSEGPGIFTLDVPARTDKPSSFYSQQSSNLISKVGDRFRFIVYDLGSEPRALVESAKDFSDVIIDIVDTPEALPALDKASRTRRFQVVNLYNPRSGRIAISHCEPFVIPRDSALSGGDSTKYIRRSRHGAAALPLRRLARKLLGSTVGVALGGGAAFGISHLGVLKVLEQNDIPIDLVAGCSQGSIIGVGYAAGMGVEEMIDTALRLGKKKNFMLPVDPTLSRPGIFAGERFANIFSPLLGDKKRFEDLTIPCRTVATDIENGERVEIGSGSLTDAFRASASVPMVFSPFKSGDKILVDGGVADPVPAEVVRNMGADFIIAVNVVPPMKKGVENEVSRAYRFVNRFNPFSYFEGSRGLPNLFDIIMNSMQILQYELGNFKAISADVRINPDLSDFTWIEYYRSEELIQRGVEAAERAMPAIKNAYARKLSPYRKQTED